MENRGGVKGPGRGFLLICLAIVCIFLLGTVWAGNEDGEIMDAFARENEIREEDDKVRGEAYELANVMTDEHRQEKAGAEELANNFEKILREMMMERKKLKDYQKMRSRKRKRREGKGIRRRRFYLMPTNPPRLAGEKRETMKIMVKCVKIENPEALDKTFRMKMETPLKPQTVEDIVDDRHNWYKSYDEELQVLLNMTRLKEKWARAKWSEEEFTDSKILEYCKSQPSHPWTPTTTPPPTTTTMNPVKAKGYLTRLIKCVKKRRPMTLDEEVGKELECNLDDKAIEDITKILVNKYGSNDKAFRALAKMADMPDEQDEWHVSLRCVLILPIPRTGILEIGGRRRGKGAVLTFGGKRMPARPGLI